MDTISQGKRRSAFARNRRCGISVLVPGQPFARFFSGDKLETIDLNNGNVEVLSEHSIQGRAAWSSGGTILFRPAERSPLFRVPASGGRAAPVRALAASDYTESAPAALPDGEHYLVVVTNQKQDQRIEFRSLNSSSAKVVIEDADWPDYSDGFLLYSKNGKILGQSFDSKSGALSGTATPILDAARYSAGGQSVLAFQAWSSESRLQWFDLNGNPTGVIGQVAAYRSPKISPIIKMQIHCGGAFKKLTALRRVGLPHRRKPGRRRSIVLKL